MKNYAIMYVMFAIFLFLASCSSESDKVEEEESATAIETKGGLELTKKQFQSSNMKLGTFDTSSFHQVVEAKGRFDVPPENNAEVSSFFSGTVKDIRLLPGEKVKYGQNLFTLENPDFVQMQQEYLEAKGQLSYLKSDYERQKNLVQDNVTSQKNYLKAESDYTVTRVRAESLAQKLKLMNINPATLSVENIRSTIQVKSPINGYVTKVDAMKGKFLSPSQTAVSIVDTDHMHLELNIFERDLAKVEVGQPIKFKIQDGDNKEYDASVYLVNKTVDAENRTIGIHGHLADEKLTEKFNPGMYVEAQIYTSSSTNLSLPIDAVVESEDKQYVLLLEKASEAGYTFTQREVKTGLSDSGNIQILNAKEFPENAKFLVSGSFNMITD
jgi:cobalt-zinc-cadmium efflux system membrane fusion protein